MGDAVDNSPVVTFAMKGSHEFQKYAFTIAVTIVVLTVHLLLQKYLWKPLRMRRIMTKQGVAAAPFHIVVGSLPECFAFMSKYSGDLHVDDHYDATPTVSPMNTLYFPKNENFFLYAWGSEQRLTTRDPEFVKEVLLTRSSDFGRAKLNAYILGQIIGHESLATVEEDPVHATHRRILNPYFFPEAIKAMVNSMVEGTVSTLQMWEEKVKQGGGVAEFDVQPDVHAISGKIISLAAFSNDFETGRQIYENQKSIIEIVFKSLGSLLFYIPGSRFLPTKQNKEVARLQKANHDLLANVIEKRKKAIANGTEVSYGNDLLGHMLRALEGKGASVDFNLKSVFNNAEAFYFAGQDTVASAMNFALLMLARHPEWQDRARKEVNEVCGSRNDAIDAAKLNRLKTVGMIINETLRLFVPLPKLPREAKKDMQIGSVFVPKGMIVEISMQAMHLDPRFWGDDVFKFNPERFANGTAKACTHPQAFVPFSVGPRVCIGNNFAMLELKVVIATILQRFEILVSPSYKHHPYLNLITRPKYGLPLILKAL
ncbi:hypothetical protein KC19_8G147200 [Ceratodon purpureus]|uniref:Cytochrome P450 n=1 Tax=Ceratodon purpureus TaxID=3225 RepID=A0A8T0H0P2_CERPU|nr:hypothetical protein KC19_8G147200 [Ceratodon purpureus]